MIQGLDQHCSSFLNVSLHWPKKVSVPGASQGRFFPWGKQSHLPWYKPSACPLLPSLMKPFTAVWAVKKGCLTLCQVAAKGTTGTVTGEWGDYNNRAWGTRFSHRDIPRFGQCLWIKDAELDTERPSGQVEQAQDTHPQGHVPRMSPAPPSESLTLLLMWGSFQLWCIFANSTSLCKILLYLLLSHHPMKLFSPVAKQTCHPFFSSQPLVFVTLSGPVPPSVGHCW